MRYRLQQTKWIDRKNIIHENIWKEWNKNCVFYTVIVVIILWDGILETASPYENHRCHVTMSCAFYFDFIKLPRCSFVVNLPAGIQQSQQWKHHMWYLFKVNNRDIRTTDSIFPENIRKPDISRVFSGIISWYRSGVFIINFWQISLIVLVSPCLVWTIKHRLQWSSHFDAFHYCATIAALYQKSLTKVANRRRYWNDHFLFSPM